MAKTVVRCTLSLALSWSIPPRLGDVRVVHVLLWSMEWLVFAHYVRRGWWGWWCSCCVCSSSFCQVDCSTFWGIKCTETYVANAPCSARPKHDDGHCSTASCGHHLCWPMLAIEMLPLLLEWRRQVLRNPVHSSKSESSSSCFVAPITGTQENNRIVEVVNNRINKQTNRLYGQPNQTKQPYEHNSKLPWFFQTERRLLLLQHAWAAVTEFSPPKSLKWLHALRWSQQAS